MRQRNRTIMTFFSPTVLLIVFVSLFRWTGLSAQERLPDDGKGLEEEVIINKDLKLELPPAQRNFEKVPPDGQVGMKGDEIEYEYKAFDLDLQYLPARLRVLKLKDETLSRYSGNYFTLGFGNFLTPYIAAGLNSSQNKNGFYGLNVEHISSRYGPIDKENSGDAHSRAGITGKYVGTKASITGDVEYKRDMVHFYGYPEGTTVDRDTLKQVFNRIGLGFDIEGVKIESPMQYGIYTDLQYVSDKFDANELGILAGFSGDYQLDPHFSAGLDFDVAFFNYDNQYTDFRSLVKATPSFNYQSGAMRILVGVRIVYLSDTINYESDTRLYPTLGIEYALSDEFTAYGRLDGDMEVMSFDRITSENPFLRSGVPLVHTSKRYELTAGIKGRIQENLSFDAGFKIGTYKNMYFFVNDTIETNKFNVIYDGGNTPVTRPFLSLSYAKSDNYAVSGHIQYNHYNVKGVPVPWHKPKFELLLSGWYNLYNKVRLGTELYVMSGITGLDTSISSDYFSETGKKKLEGITDLNFKADYIFSERYRLFVQINNIFNKKYHYFLQYPNRGLQAMIGISIDF